jgi:pyruvate,water dikinase
MIFDNTTIRPNFTIGGKATGLYKLQQAGVSVPPFLVIPAECFDPVLEPYPANEQALALRKLALSTFRLSAEDQAIITETLTAWGFPKQAVVVRSSIADEDGTAHTFAGLMDSCLNLTSHESMYEAIGQCAASAYSDRAIAYRKHKGLALNARPAVIIQQQITPLASGVLFTTFPDYPQEMAVHATFGFGEGLMQGSVEADEFYWLKESGKLHRTKIATKVQQLVTAQGEGIQSVPIPPQQQAVPCLTPDQLSGLFQLGSMLEKAYQHPQDVEFVVTEKALFIVQSRPITQPIPEIIVYDNSNIQESYCGVTTPLTFSFASRAYATVYRQTMQTLGLPKSAILEQETVITNLLGLVKGRIYYNINNWYRGLQLLPSFRQNKADMERMMGLEEPVDFVKDREKTIGEKARMLPGLLLNLGRLLWAFSGLSKKIPTFHAHFRKHYHRFYQQILSELAYYELLQQKKELDNELLGNWATPIINDFYVMMTNGSVVRKLKKAGIQSPEEFLSRYLSGDKQIESTQPVKAMQQLAAQANEQQTLWQLISEFPENLHQKVGNEYPDFHKLVTEFIDQYGDRTVGELKLETITMRLSPMVFYQYLRNYLSTQHVAESLISPTMSLQDKLGVVLQNYSRLSGFVNRSGWNVPGFLACTGLCTSL